MYSEHIHSSTQLQVLPCQSLTWISINLGGHLSAYAKNNKTKQSKTEAGNGRSHVFKGWCEATTHEDQSYRHWFAGQSAHQTTVTLTVTLESLNLGSSRLSPSPGNPLRATRKTPWQQTPAIAKQGAEEKTTFLTSTRMAPRKAGLAVLDWQTYGIWKGNREIPFEEYRNYFKRSHIWRRWNFPLPKTIHYLTFVAADFRWASWSVCLRATKSHVSLGPPHASPLDRDSKPKINKWIVRRSLAEPLSWVRLLLFCISQEKPEFSFLVFILSFWPQPGQSSSEISSLSTFFFFF